MVPHRTRGLDSCLARNCLTVFPVALVLTRKKALSLCKYRTSSCKSFFWLHRTTDKHNCLSLSLSDKATITVIALRKKSLESSL